MLPRCWRGEHFHIHTVQSLHHKHASGRHTNKQSLLWRAQQGPWLAGETSGSQKVTADRGRLTCGPYLFYLTRTGRPSGARHEEKRGESLQAFIARQFSLVWKTTKRPLLALLHPFPACACLPPWLIRRGSLFDLAESCCSDSTAPRHGAYAPLALLTKLPRLWAKEKGENHTPSLPSLLEIRHILPVCTKDNKLIQQNPKWLRCRRQLCCVHMEHVEHKLPPAVDFTQRTLAIIVMASETQWRGTQPGTWLTHTVSLPGHYR